MGLHLAFIRDSDNDHEGEENNDKESSDDKDNNEEMKVEAKRPDVINNQDTEEDVTQEDEDMVANILVDLKEDIGKINLNDTTMSTIVDGDEYHEVQITGGDNEHEQRIFTDIVNKVCL